MISILDYKLLLASLDLYQLFSIVSLFITLHLMKSVNLLSQKKGTTISITTVTFSQNEKAL